MSSVEPATIRIGCVKYLNTLPLVQGLASWREAQLIPAPPSRLIGMLTGSEVDIALASVIDAAGKDSGVSILPCGVIASQNTTQTVRLFSKIPLDQVEFLHADSESHTSVILVQLLLKRRYHRRVRIVDFIPPTENTASNFPSKWPETVLLIGDKVEIYAPMLARDYVHQLDLGQAWHELTNLPFVYAAWMCRAGEADALKVRSACAVLERARLHNATRLDWLVRSQAPQRGWETGHAAHYLGNLLEYDLGNSHRQAVETFLRMAREDGFIADDHVTWCESE